MDSKNFDKPPSPPLPVEIARLVYTFLGTTKCFATRDMYQKEHPELNELQKLVDRNILRDIEFKFHGKNLEHIMKEYVLMKYGIDKIVAKISPESESLSGLGSIMKLKKISEELTRLKENNKTTPQRAPSLKRRPADVFMHLENSPHRDHVKKRYGIFSSPVRRIESPYTMSPQLDTNYDIDNETGAVIPDLLKLQSKPLAEMNPWQSEYQSPATNQIAQNEQSSGQTWRSFQSTSISSGDSSEKSRRNALKANPPKKKNGLPQVAMRDDKLVKKKIEKLSKKASNEELLAQLVAEPLVSVFSTTQSIDATVESLMANQDYLDGLSVLLMGNSNDAPKTDTITLHRSSSEGVELQKPNEGDKGSNEVNLRQTRISPNRPSASFSANFRRSFEAVLHSEENRIQILEHIDDCDKKSTLYMASEITLNCVHPINESSPNKRVQNTTKRAIVLSQLDNPTAELNISSPLKSKLASRSPAKNTEVKNLSRDEIHEESDYVRFIVKSPGKHVSPQTTRTGFENVLNLPFDKHTTPEKLGSPSMQFDQCEMTLENIEVTTRGVKRSSKPQNTSLTLKIPRLETEIAKSPMKSPNDLVDHRTAFSSIKPAEFPMISPLKTPTKSRHLPNILRPRLTPRKPAFESCIYRTPVKPKVSELLTTPQKIDLECSEILGSNVSTPRKVFRTVHKGPDIPKKTPAKSFGPEDGCHPESTPLKALREAVRLATPSPLKHLFTPRKSSIKYHDISISPVPTESSVSKLQPRHFQTLFTPSPTSRGSITPATSKKNTPLKGLAEALSKLSESGCQTQASPTKTSIDVAKKLFTEEPILAKKILETLPLGEQRSHTTRSKHQEPVLKRAETWSSPEALHAHSTPKAIMNPSYYNPQSSRNSREPFLPNHPESSDSPLDLRQITNKSKNNSVDESENRKISNTFDASPESGNRGPSFLKLNQSVDDYNFFPAPLNPEQSNQSKGMKRGSKKVTFQSTELVLPEVDFTNSHGLRADKMSIYFSQPPREVK